MALAIAHRIGPNCLRQSLATAPTPTKLLFINDSLAPFDHFDICTTEDQAQIGLSRDGDRYKHWRLHELSGTTNHRSPDRNQRAYPGGSRCLFDAEKSRRRQSNHRVLIDGRHKFPEGGCHEISAQSARAARGLIRRLISRKSMALAGSIQA